MSLPVLFLLAVICGICFLAALVIAIVFLATGKNKNALISGMCALAMAVAVMLAVSEAYNKTVDSVKNIRENFKNGLEDAMDSLKIERQNPDTFRDTIHHKQKVI